MSEIDQYTFLNSRSLSQGQSDLIFGLQVDIPPRSYNCHIRFSWTHKWPNMPSLLINHCQGH